MLASLLRRAPAGVRHASGLPFRIRAPLAKLQERKSRGKAPGEKTAAGGLGDGEQLETSDAGADYVRLALTSRVYDMVQESPLQYAAGLSSRLQANLHIKREDLLPSFSFKIRGTYNLLADIESKGGRNVITYSVGSQVSTNSPSHRTTELASHRATELPSLRVRACAAHGRACVRGCVRACAGRPNCPNRLNRPNRPNRPMCVCGAGALGGPCGPPAGHACHDRRARAYASMATVPLAMPGSAPCACPGRAWRFWAASETERPGGEVGPLGAQPLPRMLELAAFKVSDSSAFRHPGTPVVRRKTLEHKGATVIVHGKSLADAQVM